MSGSQNAYKDDVFIVLNIGVRPSDHHVQHLRASEHVPKQQIQQVQIPEHCRQLAG